jgi:hypothetical protein
LRIRVLAFLLAACTAHQERPAERPLHEDRETSQSCVACHGALDAPTMHASPAVRIGCTDCHGGDATAPAKADAHGPGIRFVNPGDLSVADATCGRCHRTEVERVRRSMMAHGAVFWGAALYNQGLVASKHPRFAEAPARLEDQDADLARGRLDRLDPLVGAFTRGADPWWLNLRRTRLVDPLLFASGTNDHPGDYRGSGCTACHVIYANDRDPAHSAAYARYGNTGRSFSSDPTIPKDEPGHPIRHRFTKAIPVSQCIVCHVAPGATATNTYLGTLAWDNETDGHALYPENQRYPSESELRAALRRNPEEAAARGLWSDYEFLRQASEMQLDRVQIADFHGHGSLFRNVFRRDRAGNLLDEHGRRVSPADPERFKKAVHLKDIHLERGMHCVDCHFEQDVHGDGHLYGSLRAAVEITCEDCHGTIEYPATLLTSVPAAPAGGHDLTRMRTPSGRRRFVRRGGKTFQRSSLLAGKEWEVPQIADGKQRNPRSWLAKTLQRDNETWGSTEGDLAHPRDRVTCFACHTSWTASCFGCHVTTRAGNLVSANRQTVRADTFMLGVDADVTGNRVAPARSACAVLASAQDAGGEWVRSQRQAKSAAGFSGTAFSTHVPHTVRKRETKNCTDCHPSRTGDNNALLAQLLMQGTGFMNFMYRWVFVGTDSGIEAVVVTERDEPQAVIGSTLHRIAFPDAYGRHQENRQWLQTGYRFHVRRASTRANAVQLRGEYLYVADGPGGLRVFDRVHVDQLGFSGHTTTAPVAPLRRRFQVPTKDAAHVALPTTLLVDPARAPAPSNREQQVHPLHAYVYVADREEGLVIVSVASLLDSNPRNDGIERVRTFNPDGVLAGARTITVAGRFAYVGGDRGLVVVDVDDPARPRIAADLSRLRGVRAVAVQFRYAFVACEGGLLSLDVTPEPDGSFQSEPSVVSMVALEDARQVYVARTYAYVAAGSQGLAIVDVTRPTEMKLVQLFDHEGSINDCNDVQIGITNTSLFAYLADGRNGLRVVQLTDPATDDRNFGFSPQPYPHVIATLPTQGRALSLSRGLDRDRAVDESGNQIAVFDRVGARPFTFAEMARLYRLPDGELLTVVDLHEDEDVRREYGAHAVPAHAVPAHAVPAHAVPAHAAPGTSPPDRDH